MDASPRARRLRYVVAGVLLLLLGGGLYLTCSRRGPLPAGNAAGLIVTQSLPLLGDNRQGASSPAWESADAFLAALTVDGVSELVRFRLTTGLQPLLRFPATAEPRFASRLPASACLQPVPSPDRKQLAFARGGDIWVADGTTLQQVTTHRRAEQPAWSGDGDLLYYIAHTATGRELRHCAPDGSKDKLLLGEERVNFAAPAVSPDGDYLALVSDRNGSADLWLLQLSDETLTPLVVAPGDQTAPCWSPDGTMLAFITLTADEGGDVWAVNADGSHPTRLTHSDADERSVAWSPDGLRLACEVASPGGGAILLYTLGHTSFGTVTR